VNEDTGYGLPFLSLVLAIMIFQWLAGGFASYWTPRIVELTLLHWILWQPERFGIVWAFGIGLLINLLEGAPLGSASLGLAVAAYFVTLYQETVRQLDPFLQSLMVFVLLVIAAATESVLQALVGIPTSGLNYLLGVGISALLWKPFSELLFLLTRRLA
jgi:rod shape-determining protein MreD